MLSKIVSATGKKMGQVTLEYFILFSVVAMLVIVGFGAFGGGIRNTLEGFVNAAARGIAP